MSAPRPRSQRSRSGGSKKTRLMMGLMSGTSRDGVDAAVVRITGTGLELKPRLLHHTHIRYPAALVRDLSEISALSVSDVCRLNFSIAEVFAQAAIKCAKQSDLQLSRFDALASHGQTLWHIPPGTGRGPGRRLGSTLQVGEPAVIAQRTGLPVISGFRGADMAQGGQGAPLVPYVDYILFRHKAPVAAHNLGGISNLTVVAPRLMDVYAFDTGPGNSLMDAAMRQYFNKPYDRSGAKARQGRVDRRLLEHLLAHPYLRKRPPKSTGPETFGPQMLKGLKKKTSRQSSGEDIMATLAHFTAITVADAYARHVLGRGVEITEAVFSGGGTKNTFLMGLIKENLPRIKVSLSDDYNVPAGAKEALAFAVLGAEALEGNKASLPGVTGARRQVHLGSITMP